MSRGIRCIGVTALLALFLLPLPARAQVALGITGGLSISKITGDDVDEDDLESRTGLLIGGFASVPLGEIVSLTPGLYYIQKGTEGSDGAVTGTLKLDYLEIPVLLQVGVFQNETTALSLFAGPAIALEVGCELEGSSGGTTVTVDCDSDELGAFAAQTKSVTFDAIFGAGLRFATSESMFFLVNGGLDVGLNSFDDSSAEADVKNSSWFAQAGVGWIVGR